MSQENVQLAHRAFDAISRRDLPAYLDLMDAAVVAIPRIVSVERDVLHGHDGIREWWDAIFGAFPDFHIDVVTVESAAGDATVAHVVAHGRGQGSEAPFEDPIWVASRVRAGKLVWWRTYRSRDEAFAAVGQEGRGGSDVPRPLRIRSRRTGGRSPVEALTARFPGLYRRGAAIVLALPSGSRLRQALVSRWIAMFFEAYNRRDADLMFVAFDPEVEARLAESGGVPIGADFDRAWRGTDGFRRLWKQWDDVWDGLRNEGGQLLDLGDRILTLVHFVGRGRASGAEIRHQAAQLFTLRDGRVVRWEQWWEWDEALRVVRTGLSTTAPGPRNPPPRPG
ncbi:MAG: nuclear transport factor 2 family protein [Actinomycetota bacterium]|nr:nuclear transport factor 2 family protein [Actinomycetota bacterium]